MKQIFKVSFIYCIVYAVLLMVVLCLLYVYPKLELHLLMNSWHNSVLDTFFKYFSVLAEWPLYILALLPLFWKKWKITAFFAMSEITGGALLQVLKHLISMERPMSAFEHYAEGTLPLVADVDMHYGNSFPSGHASTFFMFCTCLAIGRAYFYLREGNHHKALRAVVFNVTMVLLVIFAALGAYSRVYLSQHFMADICVGSVIGSVTPWIIFYLTKDKVLKLKFDDKNTQDEKTDKDPT